MAVGLEPGLQVYEISSATFLVRNIAKATPNGLFSF